MAPIIPQEDPTTLFRDQDLCRRNGRGTPSRQVTGGGCDHEHDHGRHKERHAVERFDPEQTLAIALDADDRASQTDGQANHRYGSSLV